jgi:formylglycine-generating enzyme
LKYWVIASISIASACSLFVDTGGLDTETDAMGDVIAPQEGGDVVTNADAGDAASDVSNDVTAEAEAGACPSGKGPDMIAVPGGYCIDSTEVTRGQYAAFLASNPSTGGQLPECSWNSNFTPNPWDPTPADLPVADVDWCDAYAFCLWAGKRMCGAVGGGALSFSDNNSTDPTKSQWYRACSGNGATTYPYGANYTAGACNAPTGDASLAPVKSFSGCVGGYPGIYDMAGNVEEWQDSCDNNNGANDNCREQAGTYGYQAGDPAGSTRCDFLDDDLRSSQNDDVGIRCCSP